MNIAQILVTAQRGLARTVLRWSLPLFAVASVAAVATGSAFVISVLPDAEAAGTPAPVRAAVPVTSGSAKSSEWPLTLDASGAILPWQEAIIGTQVAGLQIQQIFVNVGDGVRRGQVLARFDAAMLRADESQLVAGLAQAEASAAQANTNRLRVLELKGTGSVSEQDILQYVTLASTAAALVASANAQLAAKRLQLRYATVVAPDDGIISARSATVGTVAAGGQELFRLICQRRLEWRGELTAAQLARVSVGQKIVLALPDGTQAIAKVRQSSPSLDAQTRLGLVYSDIEPGSAARAGMYANGKFILSQSAATVVPADSVVIRDGRSYVFEIGSDMEGARVSRRQVSIGRRRGGEVEVVRGISVGERVVVRGAGLLSDGDWVRPMDESPAASSANSARS